MSSVNFAISDSWTVAHLWEDDLPRSARRQECGAWRGEPGGGGGGGEGGLPLELFSMPYRLAGKVTFAIDLRATFSTHGNRQGGRPLKPGLA